MRHNTQLSTHNAIYDPRHNIEQDLHHIYEKNQLSLGLPANFKGIFSHLSRPNTVAIVGVALGDEGKGRIVDNKIDELLRRKSIKNVTVIRFQGGNNAGHTVEKDGIKLALHLVPSFVLHEQAQGVMDRGMVVHVEDLQAEVGYVEAAVGSLKNRLFLSDDAILCTDLERAEEFLNGFLQEGSKGGTGRGIGPSYAHHYDKTGLRIADLVDSDWEEQLTKRYVQYEKMFIAFGLKLSETDIPDFAAIVKRKSPPRHAELVYPGRDSASSRHSGKVQNQIPKQDGYRTVTRQVRDDNKRAVGSKKEFLTRLRSSREWLLKRQIVTNTYPLHQHLSTNKSVGIIFEGAQAAGLDVWTGTRPDVTSSNTTVYGVREGTGFWRIQDIEDRIGIIKLPYTSSVGARRMPTHIELPKNANVISNAVRDLHEISLRQLADRNDKKDEHTQDQHWGQWVREAAYEYGTTTGRPRDINLLDLSFIAYNAHINGVEMLMSTHLDICREEDEIKICTHYTDKKGNVVPYQPGLRYLKDVTPNYISVPGWDGKACQKAKKTTDLPIHALKFLAFLQKSLNIPFTATTTGPSRNHFLSFS